ncbi:MAG: ParA family protein [Acholeplasmataceae bacterium]|nr:ParA family protein [Acholeplasmataceae bacterium]
MKKAKVVAAYHRKGGVGKTTLTLCLAFGLARKGFRVLIIDSDSSANASGAACTQNITKTIRDLFLGVPIEELIYPSIEPNVDIIPSCFALSTIEPMLISESSREHILGDALESIKDKYDVILIDTKPGVETIPTNALCAADEVLIPIFGVFAMDIMDQIFNYFKSLKKPRLNPDLLIRGILLTKYDKRTKVSQKIKNVLELNFKTRVFETTIPVCIKLEECMMHQQSIYEYEPGSTGAIAYMKFTEELLKRWGWD